MKLFSGFVIIDAEHVTLTDFASTLPLIEKNWLDVVASTKLVDGQRDGLQKNISMDELIWGADEENARLINNKSYDLVIASDVVYQQEAYEPLMKTLGQLFARNARLVVLLAHKHRYNAEAQFFQSVVRNGLRMRDLLRSPRQNFVTPSEFKALDLDESYYLFEIWKSQ